VAGAKERQDNFSVTYKLLIYNSIFGRQYCAIRDISTVMQFIAYVKLRNKDRCDFGKTE